MGLTTGGLTLAIAVGQVVTIGREMFVAAQVGTSPRLDALLVALVVPLTIGGLLQSGTAAALVAAFGALQAEDGRASAMRLAGAILTWTTLVGLVLVAVVTVFADSFVGLAGPGLGPAEADLAAVLMPAVAPMIVVSALGYLIAGLCQVADRFRPIALASIANPLVAATLTIALWPLIDVGALGVGMTVGALANLGVVSIGAARGGVLPRPTLRARRSHAGGFLRHAGPLWASSASLTLNTLSDRAVATFLGPGAVSALRYGETVMRLPTSSIGSAWGTVAYPALVRSVAEPGSTLGETASGFVRTVVAISIPVTVGVAALAPLMVSVAFLRGAFDAADARTTAMVVAALAPTFVLSMVQAVLVGAHNALRSGVTLLAAGLLNAMLNLTLNLLLFIPFGVAGIGVSSSIAMLASLLFLANRLARREGGFRLHAVADVGWRSAVASVVPAVPIAAVAWTIGSTGSFGLDLALLVGGALAGLVGFLVLARFLGIKDVLRVVAAVAHRVDRVRHRFLG